jgi:BCD family chlorophyll transporter-like MFS transporter
MQDIILEPYGGEVLGLSVGATTQLTAMTAVGALGAFALAAHWLGRGMDSHRVSAAGALVGIGAFCAVLFSAPLESALLFRAGAVLIGFGGGLFGVGTLSAAMALESGGLHGLALGAWGSVQACALGLATAVGGTLRDAIGGLATSGALGEALTGPATGYGAVYHLEIVLLFATLIAVGPLTRRRAAPPSPAAGPLHALPS